MFDPFSVMLFLDFQNDYDTYQSYQESSGKLIILWNHFGWLGESTRAIYTNGSWGKFIKSMKIKDDDGI